MASPRIHGILALRRDPASPLGVVACGPWMGDVRVPADLPEHVTELHVFGTREAAAAFCDGVAAGGQQSVATSGPVGPGGLAVLLARFAAERGDAVDLEEAVMLVAHPSSSMAQEAAAVEDARHRRDERARQHAASWEDVGALLSSLPRPRGRRPDEFAWRYAELSKPGDGSVQIEGTLDPDPAPPGRAMMQPEYRVHLRRDGETLVAVLDTLSAGIACSPDSAAWRAAEMREAVQAAGWTTDTQPYVPAWRGSSVDGGGTALQAALLAVPEMVRSLAALAAEANLVHRAYELANAPALMSVLRTMAADPEARVRLGSTGANPPHRLDTPRGGRGVTHSVVERLMKLGFVVSEGGPVLQLSERGALAANRQSELLADAIARGLGTGPASQPVPDGPGLQPRR